MTVRQAYGESSVKSHITEKSECCGRAIPALIRILYRWNPYRLVIEQSIELFTTSSEKGPTTETLEGLEGIAS